MENSQDIDNGCPVMPATIDHEVPGIAHDAERGSGATAAEAQVVDQHAIRKIETLLNAGTLGIVADIGQCLGHQCIVTKGGLLAELLQAPVHYANHVAPGGTGDVNFIFRAISHAYLRSPAQMPLPSEAGA
jgi:hypothetical protein